MIIALINWRIKVDQEDAFLAKWKTQLKLENKPGLVGEFLSKVEGRDFHPGVTWAMEPDDQDDPSVSEIDYVSYVNVGMWMSVDNFMSAVGQYMSEGRTIREPFEAAPRRRAILSPQHWRVGTSSLPQENSPGVEP
jgi:hypothetical protein